MLPLTCLTKTNSSPTFCPVINEIFNIECTANVMMRSKQLMTKSSDIFFGPRFVHVVCVCVCVHVFVWVL
jgi:hypothetical protein